MIKVTSMTLTSQDEKLYKVSMFADTKAEVGTSEIIGFPDDCIMDMGSTVITASGELAFLKSDRTWNWL